MEECPGTPRGPAGLNRNHIVHLGLQAVLPGQLLIGSGSLWKKYADDAKSCEQREVDERTRLLEEARQRESKAFHQVTSLGKSTLDFMQDLIRKENDLALEREKEIRENMKQLAAM